MGFIFLAVVTVAAYGPALRAGFVWDDDVMLTGNPLIKAAGGLGKIWATTGTHDYWPVTNTTLWIEWRLWGMQAAGYHATNLILHLVEAGMLWAILRRLQIPGAYLAALLYAVHPVNVESVAWITQRKNLMAMLFYLASIWFFLASEIPAGRRPGEGPAGSFFGGWYGLSLAAFVLAMLSKGSAAMLPVILIGVILWRRRLMVRDGLLLAPYFLASIVLVLVDVWFQRHGTGEIVRHAGFVERLLGAGGMTWFYLRQALWPAQLIFVYPRWDIRADEPIWWIAAAGAAGMTVVLFWLSRRRPPETGAAAPPLWRRGLLFAWAYFCVMLVPALGFTDVNFMKYSLVADRYEQMAIAGVIGFVAAVWATARERTASAGGGAKQAAWIALAGAIVLLLAALTWRHCRIFRDSETLFRETIARNPSSWMAHDNLGLILAAEGSLPEAVAEYSEALRLRPDDPDLLNNLGVALERQGRLSEALGRYEMALRINPNHAEAHFNLAKALGRIPGRMPEAMAHYEAALKIRPDLAEGHYNLAVELGKIPGRIPDAVAHYEAAVRIEPDYAEAHNNLANLLANLPGRIPDALAHYEAAVRIKPDYAEAHNNLANLLANLPGRTPDALAHYEAAVRIKPDYAEARYNLAGLLVQIPGRLPEALAHYEAAVRIKPDFAEAHYDLAVALANAGRLDDAILHFELALKYNPADTEARDNLKKLRAAHR